MKKILNLVQWLIGILFAFSAFASGFHFSSIFILLAALLMMPIKPIREALKKVKIKSGVAVLLSVVILFTGIACTPTNDTPSDENNSAYTEDYGEEDPEQTTENHFDNKETISTTNTTTTSTTTSAPHSPVGSGSANPVKPSETPAYTGRPYVALNNNVPNFSSAELTTKAYEKYSPLDSLGRCGVAIASCGKEIMPGTNEERGSISSIKPSGWNQAKYDGVSGGYLWNRCHLIGWQLSAENANRQNLITGTRYMNVSGMLPFENMVADYIKETGNHVAYRVTPIFKGNNLVCSGVQIEAYSVEDNGDGICFNVYCFNIQPNITINYADGSSSSSSGTTVKKETTTKRVTTTKKTTTESYDSYDDDQSNYVYITKTGKKYHSIPNCGNTKTAYKVSLAEAKRKTEGPCSKCW